ncbi:MAG: PASTA domain-containing protein [Promethearchaeota archaeon]
MSDSMSNLEEEYFISFRDMIVEIAKGVAEAQSALDEQALLIQQSINANPELAKLGIQATWYQIPEVTASIKVSVAIQRKETEAKKVNIFFCPINASYKNEFDFDFQGTSEMTFKIVPVPSPIATSYRIVPDLTGKSEEEATNMLNTAELALGAITYKESEKEGVIGQNPPPNSTVLIGSLVTLTIAVKKQMQFEDTGI